MNKCVTKYVRKWVVIFNSLNTGKLIVYIIKPQVMLYRSYFAGKIIVEISKLSFLRVDV